jgi:hypothetical protein
MNRQVISYEPMFAGLIVKDLEDLKFGFSTAFPGSDELFLALIEQLVMRHWHSVVPFERHVEKSLAEIVLRKGTKFVTIILDGKEIIRLESSIIP